MHDATASAIPVHVLTGFLGSGKTTLLNRVLRSQPFTDAAVIVNEFGETAFDHLMVEASDDQLVELPGGCLCCHVRGDLSATLRMLLDRRRAGTVRPFSRCVIETSGLAHPNPIENLLATDALLSESLQFASVTAVVDAVNGEGTLARYPEAREQVALADQILLSKLDLQPLPPGLEVLLGKLNASATRVELSAAISDDALAEVLLMPRGLPKGDAGHTHTHDIETFTLTSSMPIAPAVLPAFVTALATHLGADLLRVKGLVYLYGLEDTPAILQGAQHVFQSIDVMPSWPAGMEPATSLTFITRGRSEPLVQALFRATVLDVAAIEALANR